MKTIILLLILMSQFTFAQGNQSFDINDIELGGFALKIVDIGEPVFAPYSLSLSAKCYKNSRKRSKIVLISSEAICEFRSQKYDKQTKTLTLNYSTTEIGAGAGQCNAEWKHTFNLEDICR